MSVLSSFFNSTVGQAVQAVAKPFIASVPVVGGYVNSRILMSPKPPEGQLEASTSTALRNFATATRTDIGPGATSPTPIKPPILGVPRNTFFVVMAVVVFLALAFVVTHHRK